MKSTSGNSTFNFDTFTKERIRHLYNIDQGPEGVLLIHEKKGDCCNSVEALHDDFIGKKNLADDLNDKKNLHIPCNVHLKIGNIWQFSDYLAVFSLWVVDTVGKKNPP